MRIQSIDRAIAILNLFRKNRSSLSLAEISADMGIAKTTIHTIVQTLVHHGFLHQDMHSRRYSLGYSLFELGALQAASLRINRHASKPLHILANDIRACCRVAIWDADTVFITLTVFPQGLDNHFNQLGPRVPGYCTGLGKAMLAHMPEDKVKAYLDKTTLSPYTQYTITDPDKLLADLEESRARGYAISNRETLLHQTGIAAPVFNEDGNVTAAASIELNPEEVTASLIEKHATRLLRTTYEISIEMGNQPLSVSPGVT